MNAVISAAFSRAGAVVLGLILLCGFGIQSYIDIPKEANPDIRNTKSGGGYKKKDFEFWRDNQDLQSKCADALRRSACVSPQNMGAGIG